MNAGGSIDASVATPNVASAPRVHGYGSVLDNGGGRTSGFLDTPPSFVGSSLSSTAFHANYTVSYADPLLGASPHATVGETDRNHGHDDAENDGVTTSHYVHSSTIASGTYYESRRVPWASPLTQLPGTAVSSADGTASPPASASPSASVLSPAGAVRTGPRQPSSPYVDRLTVRVLSAETRRDLGGKKYTTYVMRVHHPNNGDPNHQSFPGQIEHRYSDFAKLNSLLQTYHIDMELAFPPKHWAGRVGNWTPSLKWAPDQHSELVQNRKVQLDFWMVHLVEKLNKGQLPRGVVEAVYEFLTVTDRPPCDQDNSIGFASSSSSWKWNVPLSFTLGSSIRQATAIVEHMCLGYSNLGNAIAKKTDRSIPLDLLRHAKGLCFLTVVKAGFVASGRIGTGLLVARLSDSRWSAPCAMDTMGVGYGMLAGGDITHYLIVLTTIDAVHSLMLGPGVQLGVELGVAVGPVGRSATSHVSASNDDSSYAYAAYSYAHSKGLFVGVSLETSYLSARHEVNAKFYGRRITPEEILDHPSPKAAEPLYNALRLATAQTIPVDAFRPSLMFRDDADLDLSDVDAVQTPNGRTILDSPTGTLM